LLIRDRHPFDSDFVDIPGGRFDVGMFLHWRPKESILPLLLGDDFPHSIAVVGMFRSNEAEKGSFLIRTGVSHFSAGRALRKDKLS
jgi:hypothetical protein